MPEPTAPRLPRLAELVIYRSTAGVDMGAIVTQVILKDGEMIGCHLKLFPPPRQNGDIIDLSWGAPQATDGEEPARGTWRFLDDSERS